MKRWQFWLGVLVSALFLYFVIRKLEWVAFWQALKMANYGWLLPGVGVYFIAVWVRAWRWHYLLRPIKSIKTRQMFPITCIGYMGNNIYPARAGEILRAVILKRKEGVPISASLATIIVERIFDGVVMLAFVFVNLAQLDRLAEVFVPVGKWQITIRDLAIWGSIAFIGALLVFLAAAMFPRLTSRLGQGLIDRFLPGRVGEKVSGVMDRFLDGLTFLRSPFNVLMVFFTSALIWLLETVKYWFVMHAFDFQVSFFVLMLMNGVVNLATTIPAAPGYVGTFDAPGIAVLAADGIDINLATGYTLVLHLALWIPITLLGAYYMALEGVKWSDTLRLEASGETDADLPAQQM